MRVLARIKSALVLALAGLALGASVLGPSSAEAANGSVVYTYDALGRVTTVSYDTGIIIIYTYDANGNRTQQVINVNTLPLCLGTSAHSNPTTWGNGLWSTAASGC
jgi:YD repeat-containing protein